MQSTVRKARSILWVVSASQAAIKGFFCIVRMCLALTGSKSMAVTSRGMCCWWCFIWQRACRSISGFVFVSPCLTRRRLVCAVAVGLARHSCLVYGLFFFSLLGSPLSLTLSLSLSIFVLPPLLFLLFLHLLLCLLFAPPLFHRVHLLHLTRLLHAQHPPSFSAAESQG